MSARTLTQFFPALNPSDEEIPGLRLDKIESTRIWGIRCLNLHSKNRNAEMEKEEENAKNKKDGWGRNCFSEEDVNGN